MAPRFTIEDVRRLAMLARLDLTETEIQRFAEQLSGILAFAAEIQSVGTDVPPDPLPIPAGATLRDDTVRPSLPVREVLAASADADAEAGLFTVPRVFTE